MFKITFPERGEMVKPHFCTDIELAQSLEVELFKRFGDSGEISDHPEPPLRSGRLFALWAADD